MINVQVKGKYSTFEVPIDDKEFYGFKRAYWDGAGAIMVEYVPMYNDKSCFVTAFGWKREYFPDCCGANMVSHFSYMTYGHNGLKDSHTNIHREKTERFKPLWEAWYKEAVKPTDIPAIGLIPSTITKDNDHVDRSEFYSWLKSKGIYMGKWKNPIYADSLIGAYLFVHPDAKCLSEKYGISQ